MRKRKRNRYPFCVLMAFSTAAFWIVITVNGYSFNRSGQLEKKMEIYAGIEDGKDNPEDWSGDNREDEEDTTQNDKQTGNVENISKNETTDYNQTDNAKDSDSALLPEQTSNPAANTDKTETEQQTEKPQAEEVPAESPAQPQKNFVPVDMGYLDGALFIGDSRTSLLAEYAGWDNTEFFVKYGLTIWNVMESEIAKDIHTGNKIPVREALKQQKYDKIYIMLGVNELGRGTPDSFFKQYDQVIHEIRQLQPDAIIFIQSIIHVTEKKDAEGTYINNAEIDARNAKIQTLADNQSIFYLDENEVFDSGDSKKLNPEYTFDGVHLMAKYIPVWRDFLLSHGIVK